MRKTTLILSAAALLAGVSTSHATLFAYEGFDNPMVLGVIPATGGESLNTITASGSGFTGEWTVSNGSVANSVYEAAGLAYPASYAGDFTAAGGNGRVAGDFGVRTFINLALDGTADTAINSSSNLYFSWLAQIKNVSTTDAGYLSDATRATFNLAAEYNVAAGVRIMNVGANNNSSLGGTIGNGGGWNAGGQSNWDAGDSNPEVVDTWGVWNWNDVHNIFTGNGGTKDADPSANYNPAPANYDGVDLLVLHADTTTSTYTLWVNPMADGSSDGMLSWVHTDGDVVPFVMKAFGLEAGQGVANDQPYGDIVIDEIRIADTFYDAAGFTMVPEPSTYAAILGFLALAFAFMRRRRNK